MLKRIELQHTLLSPVAYLEALGIPVNRLLALFRGTILDDKLPAFRELNIPAYPAYNDGQVILIVLVLIIEFFRLCIQLLEFADYFFFGTVFEDSNVLDVKHVVEILGRFNELLPTCIVVVGVTH